MTLQTALGVAAIITAIGGVLIAFYKLKPESSKIFVDTAAVSVKLADSDRDECLKKLEAKEVEYDQYRKDAGDRMAEQATMIRAQRAEIRHLRDLLGHEEAP
jgi:hypothetical protein